MRADETLILSRADIVHERLAPPVVDVSVYNTRDYDIGIYIDLHRS